MEKRARKIIAYRKKGKNHSYVISKKEITCRSKDSNLPLQDRIWWNVKTNSEYKLIRLDGEWYFMKRMEEI